jgi:hypothetical protein
MPKQWVNQGKIWGPIAKTPKITSIPIA